MADIFVSHKKDDFQIADRFVSALRAEGFNVWWDDSLTPKDAWDATIEHQLALASVVVVLWTARSVNSDWVRTEAHYGQDRGKLVPVMMEACTIPIAFLLKQTVDLSSWQGARDHRQWRKLLTWIADLISTKPGNANIPKALGAAQPNPFREAIDRLPSGDPVVDGALVNSSTPAGTAFRDGEKMPTMRIVPSGAFMLGSPASDPDRAVVEGPQKRVEIPAPFAIGLFPVLCYEYQAAVGQLPSVVDPPVAQSRALFGRSEPPSATAPVGVNSLASAPVTFVSFDDALTFVGRLTTATGETYRLPSEAEWEYACRAGTCTRYSFGDAIDRSQAFYASPTGPIASGSFHANAFGLYDMHGNVREWTLDLWHESDDATPLDGAPATEGHGSMRVVRGGGWRDGFALVRAAARMRATQTGRSDVIGFRVARSLT